MLAEHRSAQRRLTPGSLPGTDKHLQTMEGATVGLSSCRCSALEACRALGRGEEEGPNWELHADTQTSTFYSHYDILLFSSALWIPIALSDTTEILIGANVFWLCELGPTERLTDAAESSASLNTFNTKRFLG